MRLKHEPVTRLDALYRRLDAKRIEASRSGDVPRAYRYAARAMVIYKAADAEAFGKASTYRD